MLQIKEFVEEMPKEAKVVSVSISAIIGAVGIIYALYIFMGTARVFWIDTNGKKHFLSRIPIRRFGRGYIIRIGENALDNAATGELCICVPSGFEKLHRYQPVQIRYKNNMFSLHVEKDIKVKVM